MMRIPYKHTRLFFIFGIILLATACSPREADNPAKLKVYAAVPPLAWLAGQIGGEHVDVHVMIPSGSDPHVFEPTPRQLSDLGGADLYLLGSLPFEQRIIVRIKGSGAHVRITDIATGIETADPAEHDSTQGDSHGASDPHIWLSPRNLKVIADNITEALITADPENSAEYRANSLALHRKIDDLQVEIAGMLSQYAGEAVYVQHPAFGYFLKEFGLRQEAVEDTSGSVAARHLSDLIDMARADGVRAIFTQPQFSDRGAKTVAEAIGAEVRYLDPLAADVLTNMRSMAVAIRDELASRTAREN